LDAYSAAARGLEVTFDQQQRHLFAAGAAGQVAAPDAVLQAARHRLQHQVAGVVAVGAPVRGGGAAFCHIDTMKSNRVDGFDDLVQIEHANGVKRARSALKNVYCGNVVARRQPIHRATVL
jgi:hypothetical protein